MRITEEGGSSRLEIRWKRTGASTQMPMVDWPKYLEIVPKALDIGDLDVGDRVSLGNQEGVVIEKDASFGSVKIAWNHGGENEWKWPRDLTLVSKAQVTM